MVSFFLLEARSQLLSNMYFYSLADCSISQAEEFMRKFITKDSFSRFVAVFGVLFYFGLHCACVCADPDISDYEPFTTTPKAPPEPTPVYVESVDSPIEDHAPVFEHHAPAAEIGRIGDKEDIPFLTPYPGSVLIGGVRKLGPLDLTLLATPGTDAPVAGSAVISRNYNGPEDLPREQFIRDNVNAFTKAGWTIRYAANAGPANAVVIAHYEKNSLDVWARLTWKEGGNLAYATTDPSPDDWKTMLKTTCRLPLYGIIFDFNKASLRPESEPVLERALRLLQEDRELVIEIQGHTDNIGSDEYNLKLSEARAESVRTWLIDHHMDATRLSSAGYGKRVPVADNDTDFGRAKNRRVELKRRDCKPTQEVTGASH